MDILWVVGMFGGARGSHENLPILSWRENIIVPAK
jgi:hypothetical protein